MPPPRVAGSGAPLGVVITTYLSVGWKNDGLVGETLRGVPAMSVRVVALTGAKRATNLLKRP
jgi:hypothetical protein